MYGRMIGVAATVLLALVAATPISAQDSTDARDPMILAVVKGNAFVRYQITTAASKMSEEDYAFRPTPEVRTFGQLLAHVADNNYGFCTEAKGERVPPVRNVEKTHTTKPAIDSALARSFDYCAGVYAALTDERAKTLVQFGRSRIPALAVLMYKSIHNSSHYGNVITYMRLRGKVPPTSGR